MNTHFLVQISTSNSINTLECRYNSYTHLCFDKSFSLSPIKIILQNCIVHDVSIFQQSQLISIELDTIQFISQLDLSILRNCQSISFKSINQSVILPVYTLINIDISYCSVTNIQQIINLDTLESISLRNIAQAMQITILPPKLKILSLIDVKVNLNADLPSTLESLTLQWLKNKAILRNVEKLIYLCVNGTKFEYYGAFSSLVHCEVQGVVFEINLQHTPNLQVLKVENANISVVGERVILTRIYQDLQQYQINMNTVKLRLLGRQDFTLKLKDSSFIECSQYHQLLYNQVIDSNRLSSHQRNNIISIVLQNITINHLHLSDFQSIQSLDLSACESQQVDLPNSIITLIVQQCNLGQISQSNIEDINISFSDVDFQSPVTAKTIKLHSACNNSIFNVDNLQFLYITESQAQLNTGIFSDTIVDFHLQTSNNFSLDFSRSVNLKNIFMDGAKLELLDINFSSLKVLSLQKLLSIPNLPAVKLESLSLVHVQSQGCLHILKSDHICLQDCQLDDLKIEECKDIFLIHLNLNSLAIPSLINKFSVISCKIQSLEGVGTKIQDCYLKNCSITSNQFQFIVKHVSTQNTDVSTMIFHQTTSLIAHESTFLDFNCLQNLTSVKLYNIKHDIDMSSLTIQELSINACTFQVILPSTTQLAISTTTIPNIQDFTGLETLKQLSISNSQLNFGSALPRSLVQLELNQMDLPDLQLANLQNLMILTLNSANIPLKNLSSSLVEISIAQSAVEQVLPLAHLVNLQRLILTGSNVRFDGIPDAQNLLIQTDQPQDYASAFGTNLFIYSNIEKIGFAGGRMQPQAHVCRHPGGIGRPWLLQHGLRLQNLRRKIREAENEILGVYARIASLQ
ncbi:hypothetical protein SS50377_20886 [Spironucleus salmonicida]|uniref:Uncharacterized protein n=1 Tax=Spironucleus salmonicida TaxID=348837 RepID=V6LGB0_9EUKA|nr:hypothetical protein SS50377_20886 [Spironucleus salmonicida]|eukprot:EST43562.1 Hypothetical protein SS50377_16601 [Spironucleus salmonicida]